MPQGRTAWRGTRKGLATLATASGLMLLGCSGQAERSQAAKDRFKQVVESESKLLQQKGGGGLKRGIGAPKSIKGKLGSLEKEAGPGA